jgi:hypothetical protein
LHFLRARRDRRPSGAAYGYEKADTGVPICNNFYCCFLRQTQENSSALRLMTWF